MSQNRGIEIVNDIEPISRTGLAFDKIEDNTLVVRMPLAGNANHNGIMYAGSLFALVANVPGADLNNRRR